DRVALPEPVGYGQVVGERLTTLSEQVVKSTGEAYPEIIILLDVPVFVDGQHLCPGQATQLKAVLVRRKQEFAAKGCQAYIPVGDGSLVLEDDVDLVLRPAHGRQGRPAERSDDSRHLLGGAVQSDREDDTRRIRIELFPFERGRIATELLGKQTCR